MTTRDLRRTIECLSNPTFCNFTLIGNRDEPAAIGGHGLMLRRGTAGKVLDSIVTKFHLGGIALVDDATAARACADHDTLQTVEPALLVEHSIIADNGAAGGVQITGRQLDGAAACTAEEWYDLLVDQAGVVPARGGGAGPATHIDTTYPTAVTAKFVPQGVACPSDDPLCDAADCHAVDPSLETTDYVGAFRPGGGDAANWLLPDPGACWVSFARH